METESLLRTVIETTANLCHSDPSWLDEALLWRPGPQMVEAKAFFAATNLTVLDAFPAAVPKAPLVVVVPGENISQDEFIGSYLGAGFTSVNPTSGQENYDTGDLIEANVLVVTYSPSALLCKAISQVMFWAAMVARRQLLETDGLAEMNVRLGALDISKEWSAPDENADVVFRRVVTLSWKEMFVHSTAFEGTLASAVLTAMDATYPMEAVNG